MASTVANKVIAFAANVLVVRILSKTDYGVYSYSYSIISFFLLLNGLGIVNTVLQYGSEAREQAGRLEIYRFGLFFGGAATAILCLTGLLFSFFFPFAMEGSAGIFRMLCFLPLLLFIHEYFSTLLRCEGANTRYALCLNLNSVCLLAFSALGARLYGLAGYIGGLYLAYAVSTALTLLFWLKGLVRPVSAAASVANPRRREFIRYALVCCGSNSANQLTLVLSSFLVGSMLTDPAVMAGYKVAATIPTNCYFIAQSIIVFIYPYFARHNRDLRWIQRKSALLIGSNALLNLVIGGLLILLAHPVIKLLYGSQYADAVPLFQVLTLSFVIGACLRTPCGNILSMLRRVKLNLGITCATGVLNIILLPLLIRRCGVMGAAWATLIATAAGGLLFFAALFYLLWIKKETVKE